MIIISGPEQARLLAQFENGFLHSDDSHNKHHEERLASQKSFEKQANDLIDVIQDYGYPFEDECSELLILSTRVRADESVEHIIRIIKQLGRKQYDAFQCDVLLNRSGSIHSTIHDNSLPLFTSPLCKIKPTNKKLVSVRKNADLFGNLYIANHKRDGDLGVFFSHENLLFPPSLSLSRNKIAPV